MDWVDGLYVGEKLKNLEGYWFNYYVFCRFFMWFVIIYGLVLLIWLELYGLV